LANFLITSNTENLDELVPYFNNQHELKSLLENTFKREVDLIEEKNIKNIYLLQNINKEKQMLYASAG
jgi:predicted nucleotidyltransferase